MTHSFYWSKFCWLDKKSAKFIFFSGEHFLCYFYRIFLLKRCSSFVNITCQNFNRRAITVNRSALHLTESESEKKINLEVLTDRIGSFMKLYYIFMHPDTFYGALVMKVHCIIEDSWVVIRLIWIRNEHNKQQLLVNLSRTKFLIIRVIEYFKININSNNLRLSFLQHSTLSEKRVLQ